MDPGRSRIVNVPAALCALLLAACQGHEPAAPAAAAPRARPETQAAANGVVADCGIRELPAEILQRINAARAAGRRCGARWMPPARALKWDASLHAAAAAHSLDMARRNYFEHRSPEGSTVRQRARASHYDWKAIGENIAGGDRGVDEVVQGWLESPAHCENIMDPGFSDVGVACVAQPGTEWGTYWTMVLGRRR